MAAANQKSLDAHFTVLVISSLVVTLLFVHFNPRVRRALNAILIIFFLGFVGIVANAVRDVLSGE